MRKRAFLSAVLLAALAPAVPATPASATVTVGLIPTTCDGHIAPGSAQATGNDGTVSGFVVFDDSSCGDRITWFQGTGSSWTATMTTLRGRVLDVAADATGTYLLYLNHEPPPRGAQPSAGPELAVVKRSADGTLSFPHWLAYAGDLAPVAAGQGSIIAVNGRWYAVWPQLSATPGQYVLHQAETMWDGGDPGPFAHPAPTTPMAADTQPALAMGADGQPRLFWQRAVPGGQDLLLAHGAYGAWQPAVRVAAAVRTSTVHPELAVAATSARIFTAWTTVDELQGESVLVGSSSNGGVSFSFSAPPIEAPYYAGYSPQLQASASSVFAAFGAADAPPGRALLGARFGNSPWNVTEPWASVPGSVDAFGVAGLIHHGKGCTTTVIHSGARLYAVSP